MKHFGEEFYGKLTKILIQLHKDGYFSSGALDDGLEDVNKARNDIYRLLDDIEK